MTSPVKKKSRKRTAAKPPAPHVDILDLLARCLSTADNQAWKDLLSIIQSLACRTCRLANKDQQHEFSSWLLGWPRLNAAIGCAYKKLRAMLSTGKHMSPNNQLKFFKNYFTRVIQSARNDYLKELVPHTMEEPPNNDNHDPSAPPPVGKQRRRIPRVVPVGDIITSTISSPIDQPPTIDEHQPGLAALAELDPCLRVPFLLTVMPDELEDADYAWIAQQTAQHSPSEIQKLIEDQRAGHHNKKHPLSGMFIAQLLGLSPAAVSQRVRRARLALADAINRARS